MDVDTTEPIVTGTADVAPEADASPTYDLHVFSADMGHGVTRWHVHEATCRLGLTGERGESTKEVVRRLLTKIDRHNPEWKYRLTKHRGAFPHDGLVAALSGTGPSISADAVAP